MSDDTPADGASGSEKKPKLSSDDTPAGGASSSREKDRAPGYVLFCGMCQPVTRLTLQYREQKSFGGDGFLRRFF